MSETTDQRIYDRCIIRVGQLEAENEKLRELVDELYQCSRQYGCDRCGYKDGCAIFDRMAQMGVECGDDCG